MMKLNMVLFAIITILMRLVNLEDHLLLKTDQPTSSVDRESYLSRFELD